MDPDQILADFEENLFKISNLDEEKLEQAKVLTGNASDSASTKSSQMASVLLGQVEGLSLIHI